MNVEGMGKMVGRLGELLVEQQLIERGWHPVRLDTAQMTSNADLLAIREKCRVSLQVKTTNINLRHSHSQSLSFGYSTGYLRDPHGSQPIFHSKPSLLVADVVVGVGYESPPRFVVMPVAFAEKLCRQSALEALHPIEEDIDFDAGHYHAESADGPVVHDLGRRDLGEHDQHYCAHPNASGRVAAPTAAFQCLSASADVYIEARSILICPFFAVFERGPPLL